MSSRHLHDPFAMTVVSTHATSDGVVSYLRCACGAWEVRGSALVGTARSRGPHPSTPGAHSA
ncbi:hypothetical protein OUY22_04230 [Nonomuraea sp. MCN248]|uniref:Uncharacterized protein n=1 Tax=Nonomuraea corallina TaxID=2989783 RepID=A0ABT4S604_9ACTN|nr:hypothetical protein [Nonomuraea corallina]MDA0632614.1 hypothetical protein [Nonomuraea corallina]